MRKMNKIVSAAVLAVAVAGGTYAFLGSPLIPVVSAALKDHPKLAEADESLVDADHYLKETEHDFHGRKQEVRHAIMEARTIISLIVKEEEEKLQPSAGRSTEPEVEHKHKRLWMAAVKLHDAKEYLESSKHEFHGKKAEAIEKVEKAEKLLREIADFD